MSVDWNSPAIQRLLNDAVPEMAGLAFYMTYFSQRRGNGFLVTEDEVPDFVVNNPMRTTAGARAGGGGNVRPLRVPRAIQPEISISKHLINYFAHTAPRIAIWRTPYEYQTDDNALKVYFKILRGIAALVFGTAGLYLADITINTETNYEKYLILNLIGAIEMVAQHFLDEEAKKKNPNY